MKIRNLASISILALAVNTALAQEIPVSNDIESITVKGQKLSRIKSLDMKRESPMLMDALSADNLGRLPDKNAAESLNRLPGVSILIEKGEGRFASIRGIRPDWNRVTINGFETASPEKDGSGRAMPLDVLGGELLQTVEVYKAKTADMDGEGIGGTVNITTKRPLNNEELAVTANLRYGFESADQANPYYEEESPYNADISASGKLSENIGWNIGLSTSSRQYLAQGIYQDDWAEVNGIAFPEQSKNNYYVVGRERNTAIAGLEFKATDTTNILVQGFYSKFEEFQHRNRFRQGVEQDADLIDSVVGDTVNVLQGGTFIRADLRREDIDKEVLNLNLSAETTLDNWLFSYGMNISQSELDEPNSVWDFRQDTAQDLGPDSFTLNNNGVIEFTEGGLQHNLPANLRFNEVSYQNDHAEQDIFSAKFDGSYFYQLAGYSASLKFGLKYSNNEKTFDFTNNEYDVVRNNLSGFNVTDGGFSNDVNGQPRANVWFDLTALNSLFNTSPELFSANENNALFAAQSDRKVEETNTAVYVMNTIELDDLQIIAGLRFEQTDVTSVANQLTDAGFNQVSISGDNNVLLPSLIANYHFADNLIGRASYTTNLGRPNYSDISASSSFGMDAEGDAILNIGNPDLEPYTADNYDLAIEWYPFEDSIVSAAWFNKKIDNIIINDEQTVAGGVYQGIDYDVDELIVRTKRNADTADVTGLEFNVQHQFSSLPKPFDGLGATYSYTSIDAEFFDSEIGDSRKLEDQPEEIQSFTLFFENTALYLGLTYNYNASFLTDTNDLSDLSDDADQGEFGRWDFRASYNVNDNFTVYFDANNINDEPTTEFQGGNQAWNTEYEYVGKTYYIGCYLSNVIFSFILLEPLFYARAFYF
ncbi:TonB-dependent receptor [Paraglaciecola sp. L3A3]|uniref:TonB-dependent receptor n=1 Tax=Paraglaciecola sp. L3A3 TaxID=2686358 RepID=UPI001E4C1DB6|nr:TonB-dependent receptor [Paraglaciecola sp. L3A3]